MLLDYSTFISRSIMINLPSYTSQTTARWWHDTLFTAWSFNLDSDGVCIDKWCDRIPWELLFLREKSNPLLVGGRGGEGRKANKATWARNRGSQYSLEFRAVSDLLFSARFGVNYCIFVKWALLSWDPLRTDTCEFKMDYEFWCRINLEIEWI